ncbi:PIG-L family deacetylase [Streptacidiphilus sp. PB12-B1b]|uniref:PIG-L deacetylase family protein n=1 Tax=Streptacidiphilus sp. PB12-B1b TaxID=2705012 RepID=UPI0015FA4702|nr:PIG-L deacetylase family protein [Streptacidiphilus sp. PB12-B1b]QMU78278.1 PIG-L family deacetylase [Streptacidiphilus sp. PB12-B1b]
MTIAVFAAHPDDETLGCGATIAKLAATEDVHIVVLGDGITAREASRHDRAAADALYADAEAATTLLGAASVTFERLPDLRFDTLPLLEIVWRVERVLREIRPASVFTHHPGDLNRDHQLTSRAVLTATRPVDGCPVRDLYCFEVPSSTEWGFAGVAPGFTPNVFVDVSETIETKVRAMESYRSERRAFPHPRSPEALRALARYRGSTAGLESAEAFQLMRSIRAEAVAQEEREA